MDKSPEAFRTISEVAEALETPAHVLRFWESRFPQIRPVKRAGGRRYYRPADVALLTGIKHLLHNDGLTIRGVQKILREQGVRHVAALVGGADFGHEDDVDAQLIAAMSRHPDAETDDEFSAEFNEADARFPPFLAVESAQVVALETALGRRGFPVEGEVTASLVEAADAEWSEEEWVEEAQNPGVAEGSVAVPASFETLAETLRGLPHPLPDPLRDALAAQADRLTTLRDQMELRLGAQSRP